MTEKGDRRIKREKRGGIDLMRDAEKDNEAKAETVREIQ